MSSKTPVNNGTSLAVVSWVDGDKTLARLYTQDDRGNIRESCYDGGVWSVNAKNIVATARLFTPIAACRFSGVIHVFYLVGGNLINGVYEASPGDWRKDPINDSNIKPSLLSRLAAASSLDDQPGPRGTHYALYYQDSDHIIHRHLYKGIESKWVDGGSFGGKEVAPGTGLAAVNFVDRDDKGDYPATRIFYQQAAGVALADVVVGRDFDSFQPGEPALTAFTRDEAQAGCHLSVISTGSSANPMFELYGNFKDDTVAEWGYYSWKWHHKNTLGIRLAYFTDMAMFRDTKLSMSRIYVQQVSATEEAKGQIIEYSAAVKTLQFEASGVVPTEP